MTKANSIQRWTPGTLFEDGKPEMYTSNEGEYVLDSEVEPLLKRLEQLEAELRLARTITEQLQRAQKASDEIKDNALSSANQMCRSAHEIALRRGMETNWEAFTMQLRKSLKLQHEVMHPEALSTSSPEHASELASDMAGASSSPEDDSDIMTTCGYCGEKIYGKKPATCIDCKTFEPKENTSRPEEKTESRGSDPHLNLGLTGMDRPACNYQTENHGDLKDDAPQFDETHELKRLLHRVWLWANCRGTLNKTWATDVEKILKISEEFDQLTQSAKGTK